jgi:hypothetical protein
MISIYLAVLGNVGVGPCRLPGDMYSPLMWWIATTVIFFLECLITC